MDCCVSVCRVAYAIGEVDVMYIPQDEVEYIRFMLIVDGLFLLIGTGVTVLYGVLGIIEWLRRLKK